MNDEADRAATRNRIVLLRTRPIDEWDIETLVELSRDDDVEIRDWATFGIAARDEDGEHIRGVLLERASDADFDVRSEALWGLARRRDSRAVPHLIEALQGEKVGTLFVEAAGYLARSQLIESLEGLRDWWDADPDLLEDSIARCRGVDRPGSRQWEFVTANEPGS